MNQTALVASLSELMAIPSIGGTSGEAEIQQLLAERLSALGLAVDLWPIDLAELRAGPDYPGEEVDRTQAWGLVATHRPDERPALILEGHVDVVPPGDLSGWSDEPFAPAVRDGRVVGRGACDMKGGVAAILGAVEAVAGRRDRGAAVRGAPRRRRGGRRARRVRHPGPRPHRRRLRHPRADQTCG